MQTPTYYLDGVEHKATATLRAALTLSSNLLLSLPLIPQGLFVLQKKQVLVHILGETCKYMPLGYHHGLYCLYPSPQYILSGTGQCDLGLTRSRTDQSRQNLVCC